MLNSLLTGCFTCTYRSISFEHVPKGMFRFERGKNHINFCAELSKGRRVALQKQGKKPNRVV